MGPLITELSRDFTPLRPEPGQFAQLLLGRGLGSHRGGVVLRAETGQESGVEGVGLGGLAAAFGEVTDPAGELGREPAFWGEGK